MTSTRRECWQRLVRENAGSSSKKVTAQPPGTRSDVTLVQVLGLADWGRATLKPLWHTSLSAETPETITAETLTKNMYTSDSPPLDLLIRTSGVSRLSDFMLWQCHEGTELRFLDILWPEFDLLHFLPVLLEWQWNQKKAKQEEARLGRRGGEKAKAY